MEYSQALANRICDMIAEGKSLRSILKMDGMPASSSVFKWLNQHQDFAEQYARAREAQADAIFDEMLDIADDGTNDSYEDDEGNVRTDHDVIARSKLRIETRKWMAGKLRPKKYGEKLDVNHGGQVDNPMQVLLSSLSGNVMGVKQSDD